MQGALKVSIAVMVVAGVVPSGASAQVLDVPPVHLPSVSVPPVALPAPLPQVSTPQVSTPPVSVPGARVDAPLPAVPQVRTPLPSAPRPAAPPADSAPSPAGPDRTVGTAATGTPPASSGQAPSGTVAAAGTPSASPARGGRVARAAAVPGGRGLLGTSYRSPRRLVRALSACVPGLPERQERLLVMRYGVGPAAARPDRVVASALGLTRGGYTVLRRRALRGLVRDGRAGGCRAGGLSSTAPALAFGGAGEVRPVATGLAAGARSPGGAEVAVRGERASGQSEPADEDGFATPLAIDATEPEGSLLGALMLAGALVLLAVIGVRALRTRLRR